MPLRRLQLHDRVNIRAIKPMTDRDYTVRGVHGSSGCHRRSDPSHRQCPQVRPAARCPGAYAVYHHHGRNGECEPVLQQPPGEADDRARRSLRSAAAPRSAQIGSAGSTRTAKNEEKAKRDKLHEHEERRWRKPSFSLFVKLFGTIYFQAAQLCAA